MSGTQEAELIFAQIKFRALIFYFAELKNAHAWYADVAELLKARSDLPAKWRF